MWKGSCGLGENSIDCVTGWASKPPISPAEAEYLAFDCCGVGVVDFSRSGLLLGHNATVVRWLGREFAASRSTGDELPGSHGAAGSSLCPETLQALRRAVLQATRAREAGSYRFRLDWSGQQSLAAMMCAGPARPERTWRVFLVNPYQVEAGAMDDWRSLWNFTPAECALAEALVAGVDSAGIARNRGVTANTIRFHIKHMLAKTGTSRQSQMVLVLSRSRLSRYQTDRVDECSHQAAAADL